MIRRLLLATALAAGTQPAASQHFVYVEPGVATCPAPPAAASEATTVRQGARVSGSLRVDCGFGQGSYTVTLNSTDSLAVFMPKSFIVNFGRLVGDGAFTVKFSTAGAHRITVAITSNMGSPTVHGRFASAASEFNVVPP